MKFELVELFLTEGADPDTRDHGGFGIAHMVAKYCAIPSIIHSLMRDHGVDVNMVDDVGRTSLFHACEYIRLEETWDPECPATPILKCIQALLEEHANPNAQDQNGDSVLDYALQRVYYWLDCHIKEIMSKDREKGGFDPSTTSTLRVVKPLVSASWLDIAKQIYDLIEQWGGRLSRLETPHGPNGKWSALKPGLSSFPWLSKEDLASDRLEVYMNRI
ncbi:hypothetical protein DL93DRAFT_570820 [Clavulina sp. PMI_390]|nr:hypothetical protein DL93DRAFT_570820 [Clavulina sp. PMI_390]